MLQVQILLELQREPARSVEQLARRMDKLRPSVSRSIQLLQRDGLVVRAHARWELTSEGVAEAERSIERTRQLAASMQDALSRLPVMSKPDVAAAFGNSSVQRMLKAFSAQSFKMDGLLAGIPKQPVLLFPELSKLSTDLPSVLGMAGMSDALKVASQPHFLPATSTVNALLKAQEQNNRLISSFLHASDLLVGSIAKSVNLSISSALDDVLAIRSADLLGQVTPAFLPAALKLPGIVESMGKFYDESLGNPAGIGLHDWASSTAIALPPVATAGYSRALRLSAVRSDLTETPSETSLRGPDGQLEEFLAELGTPFLESYRGMWAALNSGHPDHLRHAAVSARELVRKVFQSLIPDADLDLESRGPLIKPRVKRLLGGSESGAAWVTHFAQGVVGFYEQLNSFTHDDRNDREALVGLVVATDGMLLFFLARAGGRAN